MMNLKDDSIGAELLSVDEIAIIFSFLPPKSVLLARVCTTWRDAAKKTIVPLPSPFSTFCVHNLQKYNLMRVMAKALPNLQQISISSLDDNGVRLQHKYYDGEDPDEDEASETADYYAYDIDILSNFSKLRSLDLYYASLNGRYPVFFNFPLLQRLYIEGCECLKIDLEMLTGLPSLKELKVILQPKLSGNLNSLRPLKDTLESIFIHDCHNVRGNFMDLADFPHLKRLSLEGTSVTGDVRDIGTSHFPSVSRLHLPNTVVGGTGYAFLSISEVPHFMWAIHALLHRIPGFRPFWRLSADSPDWYDRHRMLKCPTTPFCLRFVEAGPRLGWRWYSNHDSFSYCEINWLDPEPSSDSSDYEIYVEGLQRIEESVNMYGGYYQPPSEEEYHRLCDEHIRIILQPFILLTMNDYYDIFYE